MDWIKAWFVEQGTIGVIAQLIGFCAMASAAISFQQKTQKRIVIGQCICSSLWSVHMLLIGAWAGTLLNVVAVARALVFSYREEHAWARRKEWYAIFIGLFAVASLIGALGADGDGWWTLLAFIGMIFSTFSFGAKDPFKVRVLSLIGSPLWLIYDFFNGSIPGTVAEIGNMTSIISAMIRLDLPAYRKRKKQNQNELLK